MRYTDMYEADAYRRLSARRRELPKSWSIEQVLESLERLVAQREATYLVPVPRHGRERIDSACYGRACVKAERKVLDDIRAQIAERAAEREEAEPECERCLDTLETCGECCEPEGLCGCGSKVLIECSCVYATEVSA